jgi:hypothetical protein
VYVGPEGMVYLRELGSFKLDILPVGGPPAGDNAILRMICLVEYLRGELEPRFANSKSGAKQSTINISRFTGRHNGNGLPGSCVLGGASLLMRTKNYRRTGKSVR